MTAVLQSNSPGGVNFGDVTTGGVVTLQVLLYCYGDEGLTIDTIQSSDSQYTTDITTASMVPGQVQPINITFTPTGPGTVTATLFFTGNFANSPLLLPLTGRAVAPGSQLLSVDPGSGFVFPVTVNGATSPEQLFVLTNTGTVSFNVTALAFNGQYQAGPTQPALPYTLAAGASVSVGVQFIPNANGYFVQANGLVITSGASGSPLSIALAGTGIPFVSAYVLTGDVSAVLAAFGPVIQQFTPGEGSEAGCATDRLTALQSPGEEKGLYNIQVDYEDLGPATLLVQVVTRRGDTSEQSLGIGTPAANEEVLRTIANLQVSEEVFHVRLFAVQGPISICGYSIEFEPGGEVRKDS